MNNDLISRNGVSAWLYNMGYSKLSDYVMDEKRFPSVFPLFSSKEGEWIDAEDGTYCNVCFKYAYDDGEYHFLGWRSNFCPNCGVNMRNKK